MSLSIAIAIIIPVAGIMYFMPSLIFVIKNKGLIEVKK